MADMLAAVTDASMVEMKDRTDVNSVACSVEKKEKWSVASTVDFWAEHLVASWVAVMVVLEQQQQQQWQQKKHFKK